MFKYFPFFVVTLLTSIVFSGCNHDSSSKSKQTTAQMQKKQVTKDTFTLKDTEGKSYTFIKKENGLSLKNSSKILMIDIFATWCPPCQAEAKVLSNLQKKYSKNIKIFGLSIEKNIPKEKLEAFKTNHNLNYTFLIPGKNNQEFINQIASAVLHKTTNIPIPFIVMYKEGKLIQYYIGATEEEFIQSDIKQHTGK